MYNLKLIAFAAFLLASEVFAGRITYTAFDKTGGIDKKGKWEQKAGGKIPDNKDAEVLNNIGTWSQHKYSATKNARTGVIIVKAEEKAENKDGATRLNNEGQSIVNSHIR